MRQSGWGNRRRTPAKAGSRNLRHALRNLVAETSVHARSEEEGYGGGGRPTMVIRPLGVFGGNRLAPLR